jgi:hypothetical protein
VGFLVVMGCCGHGIDGKNESLVEESKFRCSESERKISANLSRQDSKKNIRHFYSIKNQKSKGEKYSTALTLSMAG